MQCINFLNRPTHWPMWIRSYVLALLLPWLMAVTLTGQDQDLERLDYFEKYVRPILIEKCLDCHSSETGKTSGGLSLDSQSGWEQGGDSGAVIIAGDPENSLLIRAIGYSDSGLQMPPVDHGGKLTDPQIDILVRWVKDGAYDPRTGTASILERNQEQAKNWWAFQPLREVAIPHQVDSEWSRNPIDSFIRVKQLQQGVVPNIRADKRTLLKRVTYGLTGLPPSLSEMEDFDRDLSTEAYAQVIDRLLDSPAYGEHWGGHWLDIARYADTAGDGADYPVREAYRYRNWVIAAIADDLPIDRFLAMQIAGDILAQDPTIQSSSQAYADSMVATGFLAIGKRYGYAPNSDYQHLDFADALDSIGRSVLGLSLGCARCHDHKYDPISTEDYYAWYGLLESTQWAFPGGEEHKRPANFPAMIPERQKLLADAKRQEDVSELEKKMNNLRSARNRLIPGFRAGGIDLDLEQQSANEAPKGAWLSAGPNVITEAAQSPFHKIHPPGKYGVRVGSGKPHDGVRYVFENSVSSSDSAEIYFQLEFKTLPDESNSPDSKRGAYRFYLGRGVVASTALDVSVSSNELAVKVGGAWKVISKVKPDRWYSLTAMLEPRSKWYQLVIDNGETEEVHQRLPLNPQWDGVIDTFICDGLGHIEGPASARDLDNLGLSTTRFVSPTAETDDSKVALNRQELLTRYEGELQALQQKLDSLKKTSPYEVAYGVREARPVDAHVQKRGEPDKLGPKVPRRNLTILGQTPVRDAANSSGRLDLAQWLTHPDNPLTARVFVNRVWQWHFGTGLVRTPSDFGLRGEEPTHPELLDWLTLEFIRSGWSLKHLHRLILSSHVYQLSSEHRADLQMLDPENRWYWKYTRRPLSAEEIRDTMMYLGGTLNRLQPQGHPFPDVNTWGFTIHNPFHAVYDSDHRSVYLMKQRNRRHPFLSLFDGADPNQSQATRMNSTTPTQSLYLMNSPFVSKQAAAFADRVRKFDGADRDKIRWAIECSSGFSPSEAELNSSYDFLMNYSYQLRSSLGDSGREIEPQAWEALCRVLMTSNSLLFID